MWRYSKMVVVLLMVECNIVRAPPPIKLTIDCGPRTRNPKPHQNHNQNDMRTFCDFLHHSLPKAVKDGKFVLLNQEDLETAGDEERPAYALPPKGFVDNSRGLRNYGLNRFRPPRVQIPRMPVPTLKRTKATRPPVIRSMIKPVPRQRQTTEEYSSAEKIERFKKGVQKMLHVVKMLGQIDQYLSQRMRILIDKLSTTFAE